MGMAVKVKADERHTPISKKEPPMKEAVRGFEAKEAQAVKEKPMTEREREEAGLSTEAGRWGRGVAAIGATLLLSGAGITFLGFEVASAAATTYGVFLFVVGAAVALFSEPAGNALAKLSGKKGDEKPA